MWELAGLESAGLGEDPATRRGRLVALSDDALVERLVAMASVLRDADAEGLAREASLPLAEVVASPFGMRAVALAVREGAKSRHRELRAEPAGTADPTVADPDHGVWDRGVLRTGKYQGFYAESPFATYDPSHTAKWGPHELTHRAAGFGFDPSMSRFELYLCARLNELVPVVLWYGPDQVMRLDEARFDREDAGVRKEATLDRARFWNGDDLEAHAKATVRWLRAGIEHFERELAAIDEERQTGRRVRVRHHHPGAQTLDASSDATAYVVGHEARLRRAADALSAVDERWRAPSVDLYRERVEDLFDRLLFGAVAIDPSQVAERRGKRQAWDSAHREAIAPRSPEVPLDGSAEGLDLAQLRDGLGQVAPASFGVDEGTLEAFAKSDAMWRRAPLAVRWRDFLDAGPRRALATLEAAILTVGRDDAIEHLCEPLGEGGHLVWSESAERLSLAHDALGAHAHFAETGEPVLPFEETQHLIVVGQGESIAVVPVSPALAAIVGTGTREELAAAVAPDPADDWLRELIAAGVLGWRPR